jgi:hypothetical protein
MLHWYRLAEETLQSRTSRRAADSGLIAHGRSSPTASLSPQDRRKLFWLGLIEATPLFAGGVFTIYTDSSMHAMIAALIAIVLTSIVCWSLRHQTPLTGIEFTQTKTHEDHTSPEEPKSLDYDISLRFTCGTYSEEKVILCCCAIPTTVEGMFFKDENLVRSEPFEMLLIYGGRILGSKSDTLPIDWSDPQNVVSTAYDKLDKGVFARIPFVGPVIESLLPDARWRQALWYQIVIDETGRCDYKIHIGPENNPHVRNKCEGTCQL